MSSTRKKRWISSPSSAHEWVRLAGKATTVVIAKPLEISKLVWHFAPVATETIAHDDETIDYILPTTPPWYIDNLFCGELTLPPHLH
ncbi:MAG: hypothetical protein H7240_05660 [Glaciimonas sp.]|nr:hypothetical protein [Glaciimonas sp.]